MLGKYSKNRKDARTTLSIYSDLVGSTSASLDETGRDVTRGGSSLQERTSKGVSSQRGTIERGLL